MYQIRLKQYSGTVPVTEERWALPETQDEPVPGYQVPESCVHEILSDKFPCSIQYRKFENGEDEHFTIRLEALRDMEMPISVSFQITRENWKRTEYVFMPAAAYNGNRMESKRLPYPPYYAGKAENG